MNGPGGLWVDVWVTGGFILTLILLHALTHTSVCDVIPHSWRGGWLLTERLILRRLKPSVRGVHWLAVSGSGAPRWRELARHWHKVRPLGLMVQARSVAWQIGGSWILHVRAVPGRGAADSAPDVARGDSPVRRDDRLIAIRRRRVGNNVGKVR